MALLQLQTTTNILAALESRAVDGGVLSPPTNQQAMAMGYRELGNMQSQPFEYPASVLAVRANTLRDKPDQVRRVVYAVVEAIARIKNDRATAEASIQSYTGVDDPDSLHQTYDVYAPTFERDPIPTETAMQAAVDDLAAENPQAANVAAAATLDAQFVRDVEASGLLQQLYP